MAHFFRLIAFLFFSFLATGANAATADACYGRSPWGGATTPTMECSAACSALAALISNVHPGTTGSYSAGICSVNAGGGGSYNWSASYYGPAFYYVGVREVCPDGSLKGSGACPPPSCPAGHEWNGTACAVNEQQALCNALSGTEVYGSIPGNAAPGSTSCNVLGCSATLASTVIRVKDSSGQYVTEGALTFTDQVCTYSADSGSVEDSCPGGASGELNGVVVCVPYDPNLNTIESVKASTSTTANGSGTVSTVTTTNTTCTNGSCNSTSTTVVNNNGTPSTETKTTKEPQTDYCAKNPNDPQCTNKGSFSGACSAGFTCSGDAVQCAIARELHSQNCKLNAISTESAIYDASKGKSGNQTTDLPGNEAHTFGPATFDQTDALGGGSCIADLSIDVLGNSVTLPTSKVCPYLLWLRSALLAIGAILWLVIVFRA